jgi:hypothetical protein
VKTFQLGQKNFNRVKKFPPGQKISNESELFQNPDVRCRAFDVNFGEVTFPERLDYPRPQKISAFNGIHNVKSGRVVVVDAQTFLIPNFSYDGTAPDAHFWVGKGTTPGPEGETVFRL